MAALDRALAEVRVIEENHAAVRRGQVARASAWARDAIAWMRVEIRWAECKTSVEAVALKDAAVQLLLCMGPGIGWQLSVESQHR
ncbi:hypothetical protein IWX78_003277 [Mycetocola sp. CAN_C7]|uniref:hypothetical protein n=1 Tax=Mycetocola sp. CAN_C7 TaxID=2787724 RepID=UPI0018CA4D1E